MLIHKLVDQIIIFLMSRATPRSKRFQQLRWRLTLTYTAVTVGALITVELLLLLIIGVGGVFLINSGYLPEQLVRSTNADFSPVLEFYLSQSPPDYKGMQEWLTGVGAASSVTFPLTFDATDEMLIVDSDGALLAVRPPDLIGFDLIGKPFSGEDIPGLKEPLQAALAGVDNPENLYSLDNNGHKVILALPIHEESSHEVLGALVAIGELPTIWSQLRDILPILGVSFLLFTLIAGIAGTVYGFLAARGPVRRLDQLAEATLAWSEGDFSVRVEDPSGDELGLLAHRLNEMSRQLESLMETRRELAVVEERNRLARDLHDSAKQQAFAAAAQISAARKHLPTNSLAAETHVQEAERLILALRQELTNLIQQLRPVGLNGKGLSAALKEYCEEWSRQSGIQVELRIRKQKSLPLEIEQTIFRIVQEALSNISRHSQASQVEIELSYTRKEVSCTIQDNGVGFNPQSIRKGLGLQSMQERTFESGGRLEIATKPGEGTSIKMDFPFNDDPRSDVEEENE